MNSRAALLLAVTLIGCGRPPANQQAVPAPDLGAAAVPNTPSGVPLAVTIDDLPWAGVTRPGLTRAHGLQQIVHTLVARRVPATGFFVCGDVGSENSWAPWMRAGLAVANHSSTHRSVDAIDLAAWIDDVRSCRDRLTKVSGDAPKYFRFPYLQTGKVRALRDDAAKRIVALGHVRAPVSYDTSDWAFVDPYVKALHDGDRARANEIADAYLLHLRLGARHYRRVAIARVGREVAQVMLLHANSLLADHLGRVLDMLQQEGFRFVDLDEALADDVYARHDDWVDPVGGSWLYRIAPADLEAWGWDQGQLRAMRARFGLRENRAERIGPGLRVAPLEGVPAWVATQIEPVAANSLVYLTKERIPVLVDTPMTPGATQHLLDWIVARFGRLPGMATVSHYHFDASAGIGPLTDAGVPIVVSQRTARLLRENGADMLGALFEMFGDAFTGWTPPQAIPNFMLSEGATHRIGGTEVRVIFPGAAHAPDNVVTFFPESGVLFGGCMVKGGKNLGYLGAADLDSWPGAIGKLAALNPRYVIPGHGGRVDVAQLEHTLQLIAEKTRR